MKLVTDPKYKFHLSCVLALGCFDGVHIGHAAVIGEAVRTAHRLSLPAVVWTFSEPPRNFYSPGSAPLLADAELKRQIIASLGADVLVEITFNEENSAVSPEDFFRDTVLGNFSARHVVCGFNFTFGAGGKGNSALLASLCSEYRVGFTEVPPVSVGKEAVSSSAIRRYIESGETEMAARMLGRPYSFESEVINGQHLARRLGFPTFNQEIGGKLCMPRFGVYFSRAAVAECKLFGITNIGKRPTVDGHGIFAETHILDYGEDLYGRTIRVELLEFMRPERKFGSVDELAKQVISDIGEAKIKAQKYST